MSEYRQGNFAGAIEWEQKTLLNQKDVYRTAQAYMVMAMAQHGLKQLDQARATLAQGLQYVESNLPKLDRKNGLDEMWNDWITAQVLVHEAKTLIDANPAGGESAK